MCWLLDDAASALVASARWIKERAHGIPPSRGEWGANAGGLVAPCEAVTPCRQGGWLALSACGISSLLGCSSAVAGVPGRQCPAPLRFSAAAMMVEDGAKTCAPLKICMFVRCRRSSPRVSPSKIAPLGGRGRRESKAEVLREISLVQTFVPGFTIARQATPSTASPRDVAG